MGNDSDILAVEVDFNDEDFLPGSIFDIEGCYPVSGVEYCYCISCDARQQASVVKRLPLVFRCHAFSPIKVIRKWQGRAQGYVKVPVSLLPGYVFLFTYENIEPEMLRKIDGFNKVLQYDVGIYKLNEQDEKFARWLLKNNGIIGELKVYYVGDRIMVSHGHLGGLFGEITKVDKRKHRVHVEFTSGRLPFKSWLDYEMVDATS
jgi:transcription antitermination factor NusG